MLDIDFVSTVNIINEARKNGIILFLDDDIVKYTFVKGTSVDHGRVEEIKKFKSQIKIVLSNNHVLNRDWSILAGTRPGKIPLSFSQERLWFIDALEGSLQYHQPFVLRLKGELDVPMLEKALKTIVNRHEVLRTVIRQEDGRPYQHILDKDGWKLGSADNFVFTDEPSLADKIDLLISTPFDLAADYMLRGDLIKTGQIEHILVGTMHHIISDGWSIPILVRELADLYNALVAGRPYELPSLPVQYADYAIWQRQYLSGQVLENKMAYWQQQLSGAQVLNLPTDYARPHVRSSKGAAAVFHLDNELAARIEKLALDNGATLYMTLLSVFNILLYKYSGQDDICVGSPIAGRQHREVEGLIGFFVNTLVLRSRVSHEMTFRELLRQMRKTTLDAYAHQDVPFEKIVEALVKERDMSRSPLFDVMFVLQNNAQADSLENGLSGLSVSFEGSQNNTSLFDIMLTLQEIPGGISGAINYCSDLYDRGTIERMMAHYERLLRAVVSDQDLPLAQLEMITEAEREELLSVFNDTAADYPKDKTIVDLFYQQAAKTPDSIAVVFEDRQLSYRQLDERSNQLAHYLRSKGVREDTLVAICLERSLEMITGILGILKAGGAYVPIDPDYPQDRIAYMLEDTAAKIAITAGSVQLPASEDLIVINISAEEAIIGAQRNEKVKTNLLPDNLAYVIYTSGSTGWPKGVMIEHKGLINMVLSHIDFLTLQPGYKILQFASFSFDGSCQEIFNTLSSGCTLILISNAQVLSAELLQDAINTNKVDIATLPPSYQSVLQHKNLNLQILYSAGEMLNRDQALNIQQKGIRVINGYGPTENTVTATLTGNPILKGNVVTIGRPIPNTQIYILGPDQDLVPIGVTGEICIGGAGLARGYLNRSDLTAQKFIPHPFSTQADARIYKTGDLGRWLPDGNIEFLGRSDDQVKIRGYRIELGEIESIIAQTGLVQQSVVLAKEDSLGNKRLIGYVVPANDYQREDVMAFLRTRLPEYMVPGLLVELESLPLTHNGKTDRKALLTMDLSGVAQPSYQAPRNELEEKLAAIWADLLNVQQIGIHDNFFELGGDSIITIQVVSRLLHAGYSTRPRDIFIHQTIAALAAAIAEQDDRGITAEQGTLTGKSGLLPIQQWYLNRQVGQISHYNQSVLLGIDKSIPVEVLQQAVQLLTDRHDALRFRYEQSSSGWEQYYSTGPVVPLIVEDLITLPELLALRIMHTSNDHQRSLDIRKGELIRVVLMKTASNLNYNRLLIVIHHLVVDGVSWRILLEDLGLIISALMQGNNPILSNKSSSYRQWYDGLAEYGKSRRLLDQQAYWHKTVQPYRPLPYDHSYSGPVKIKDAGHHSVRLSHTQTQLLLQDVPAVYHTEINDILLATLAKTICEWSKSEEIVIGLEGHGREDILDGIDLTHTVGWFTSLYPVLLSKGAGSTIADWIKNTKEQLRKIPDKGLGYGILKHLNKEPQLQGDSPFDIVFNYLGQFDNVLKQSNYLTAVGEPTGNQADPELITDEKLSINSMVTGGELVLTWSYSTLHFSHERIQELSQDYLQNLELLISHCIEQHKSGIVFTPSDYGLGNDISYDQLDKFFQENTSKRHSSIAALYHLSDLQQGMLFHGLYEEGSGTYVGQFGCELVNVDIERFIESWAHLIRRHSILRSSFEYDTFKVPVQCVYKQAVMPVELLDYRGKKTTEQEISIRDYEVADRRRGFDFKAPPLMRVALLRLSEERYYMLWSHHHILCDGWSVSLLMGEFLSTYESLITGTEPPEVREDKYEDYIRYIESRNKHKEEQYWRSYLKGVDGGTLLPFISIKTGRNKGLGQYKEALLSLDERKTTAITAYTQSHKITINTLMQGVWSYLLHRYTGSSHIVYGVTVSGRPDDLPGVEERVGLYINTLPLHSALEEDAGITQWLQSIQQQQLESREHQYTGLNTIQGWAGIQGDLFDTLLVFENYPVSKVISSRSWLLETTNLKVHEQANYPLGITIGAGSSIGILFTYNADLIEEHYIQQLLGHFEQVLLQITEERQTKMGGLKLLTEAEREELLSVFNDTAADYPKDKTIVDLFYQQAAKTPDSIAVVFEDRQLSYRQLDERSNQLAHYLRSKGVREDTLVAICLERSLEMITGILGILKAGGAYVPIDPDYPQDRIAYMLEDTAAKIAITAGSVQLPASEDLIVINISAEEAIIGAQRNEKVKTNLLPDNLAYVIYTSGSTGHPKGVMIEHKSLSKLFGHVYKQYLDAPPIVMAFTASYTFDISIFQLLTPLLSGGRSIVLNKELLGNIAQFATILKQASIIDTVPAVYNLLVNHIVKHNLSPSFENIQKVFIGGDVIPDKLLTALSAAFPAADIIVTYGPTEGAIFCTSLLYSQGTPTTASKGAIIGRPISNTQIYILGPDQDLVPIGVTGEICIGGAGLARGYLNRPDLTAQKFIPHPFSTQADARIYKTGDMGRWLPDGNIEFLGRSDDQVKIRGYRIELGEIENTLMRNEMIRQAVVQVETGGDGDLLLRGYYVEKASMQLWPSISEYMGYNEIAYYAMNNDEQRSGSYQSAIASKVKGKIVVDVGTGPDAILAQHCISSGAKYVYAIEILEDVYNQAKEKISALGLSDRIIVLHGDVKDIELPEQVDYCVCALVGNMGSSDGCIPIMNSARRLLKDSRNMIPYRSVSYIAAVDLLSLPLRYDLTKTGAYYLQNIFEKQGGRFDLRICIQGINESDLLSDMAIFEDIDLTLYQPEAGEQAIKLELNRTGRISGFVVWLQLHATEEIVIDILKSQRSFLPVYIPAFGQGVEIDAGDSIIGKVRRIQVPGTIYPDYEITGTLIRRGHASKEFSYISQRLPAEYRGDSFYNNLFSGESVAIRQELTSSTLRSYMEKHLPAFMIPASFVKLSEIPLTKNGKIDRRTLSQLSLSSPTEHAYEAARNPLEQQLAAIWADLLNVQQIGIHDNFFELGGHSLLAIRLVSSIRRELDLEISIGTIFNNATIALLAAYISGTPDAIPALPAILAGTRPGKIPLSFSQERLWFIDALEGSLQYHQPFVLRLKGELDVPMLEKALKTIVNRHEVLRTVIRQEDGRPYQHILDKDGWKLGSADNFVFTDEPSLADKIDLLISTPFDLAADYMLRGDLIKTGQIEHILVGTMHHIISDGWSIPILVRELADLYNALVAGRPYELPSLPVQYADYAIWQRQYLSGQVLENKMAYWQQQLSGAQVLNLPTDYARPHVRSSKGAAAVFHLDNELAARIEKLALDNGATLYMTLLSVFNILLYKYSGQDDICVGSPIAGRQHREVEGLIGFFVNTLVLRSRVSHEMTFRELLRQMRKTTLDAYAHQDVPFEKIVKALVKERDMSRSPLFDVMFVLQNNAQADSLENGLSGLSVSFEGSQNNTSLFDIMLTLQEIPGGISGAINYCSDLYDRGTIERMMAHYERLLRAVVSDQDLPLAQLEMITEAEREELLSVFNDTAADYPKDKTIVDLFYQQAAKTPDSIAVVFEDRQLSYRQLDERSNQLAHYLRSKGVREDTLVAICLERSLEMITGILGILKAGGAYVPIDPDYPQDRIAYMLEDTAAKIAITAGSVQLPASEDLIVINISAEEAIIGVQRNEKVKTNLLPDNLAYVIYTSGSTGHPKGVMIEHRSVVNLLIGIANEVNFTSDASFLSITTYSFDISYLELYMPLVTGGRLFIISKDIARDGFLLLERLHYYRPTYMQGTPSTWQLLTEAGWTNEDHIKMLIGGESVKEEMKTYLTRIGDVWNVYGPTETTIWSSIKKILTTENITIGRPISNTQIYILGPDQDLVPIGVTGEICIGGAGLARGYLNRSDLTAQKFIPHPFSTQADARIYKTGDLGRWLPDGNIEFLGRSDDQVKIRGYRIELGEIESIIAQTGLVQQSVVLAKEDSLGNKRLIGYVVPANDYQREDVMAFLRTRLPEYMVPGLLVELESLPLTHNGKTDRKALLTMDLSGVAQPSYQAPRNELEEKLAAIWTDLLNVQQIGIHDNFFELGGDSLLAIRLVSSIRRELDLEISIGTIFNNATIALLAAYISGTPDAIPALPAILAGTRPGKIPLSFSQERLWFIDALEGSLQYHQPFVLRLKGELDVPMLEKALKTIVNRHEVLRTVIRQEDGRPYQHILDKDGWKLGSADNFVFTDEPSLADKIDLLISTPFDLAADYMLRGDLIKTGQIEHILVGTMHHIISDGWSIPILVRELADLYNALVAGRPYELPSLPVQYADYAIWQRQYLSGQVLENKMAYWQQQLSGAQVLNLPTDYARPHVRSSKGAAAVFHLDNELAARIEKLALDNGATLYMTLLSVFNILLYKYSGQDDICVGSPIAGRQHREVEGLIGFFVNTLVLRSRVSHEMTFRELLRQMRKTTLDAYAHQDVPFEKIVKALVKERDMSRSPLFDVKFALHILPETKKLDLGSKVELIAESSTRVPAAIDVSLDIYLSANGLEVITTYCSDLYDRGTIERMMAHYERLLRAVVSDQDLPLAQLEMITEAEREELLSVFNDTAADYPKDKTIVDLFYQQAAKTPDSIAVVFEDRQLSYRQLDERSNQLAHYLRSKGVREDTLVAICLERSLEMITGILGILKAGGAYVPIDPDYPQDRIAYMLEDTAAKIAITAGSVQLPASEDLIVINISAEEAIIGAQRNEKVKTNLLPDNLAYVIYTSGSTGWPKGVMIEHKGLINMVLSHIDFLTLQPGYKILQFASFSFDGSCQEIFNTLSSGCTLILISNAQVLSAELLQDAINTNKVDIATLPPSYQSVLQHKNLNLQILYSAGEMLNRDQALNIQQKGIRVINGYGPTENTVTATLTGNPILKGNVVTIGRPIPNTQIYILGPDQDLVPIGVTGEICIGGAGLARGYLNRSDLTAQKFIPHPFSTQADARIYKTGDLGRWLPDGNIEFLGRSDDQVKIRGYRIELGEIESIIAQTGLVQQSVVLAKEDSLGNKRLIGYVVPANDYQREDVMAFLRTRLPEYMVPGLLVELESLPLTHNGKTDRKALLTMDLSGVAQPSYQAPRNELEEKLAAIWADLLNVQQIGIHDNFFELGGHSLLAIRLVSSIRRELAIGLSIDALFKNPTIIEITNYIKSNQENLVFKKMSLENEHIFQISTKQKEKIIFFISGITGICSDLDELVLALTNDFQIYGLQMLGLFEKEIPLKTIEEIAAQNIKWMKTIQPVGPYRFFGHSFAGYIVYEMAKQLARNGDKIDLPLILDTNPVFRNKHSKEDFILFTKEMLENYNMLEKVYPDWAKKLEIELSKMTIEETPSHIEKALRILFPKLDKNIEFAIRVINLMANNYSINYEIKERINVEGIIISASDSFFHSQIVEWSKYFENSSIPVLKGTHGSIVKGQGAIEIVHLINTHLEMKNKGPNC